jgi:hypothetical protein
MASQVFNTQDMIHLALLIGIACGSLLFAFLWLLTGRIGRLIEQHQTAIQHLATRVQQGELDIINVLWRVQVPEFGRFPVRRERAAPRGADRNFLVVRANIDPQDQARRNTVHRGRRHRLCTSADGRGHLRIHDVDHQIGEPCSY